MIAIRRQHSPHNGSATENLLRNGCQLEMSLVHEQNVSETDSLNKL